MCDVASAVWYGGLLHPSPRMEAPVMGLAAWPDPGSITSPELGRPWVRPDWLYWSFVAAMAIGLVLRSFLR